MASPTKLLVVANVDDDAYERLSHDQRLSDNYVVDLAIKYNGPALLPVTFRPNLSLLRLQSPSHSLHG